MKTDIFDQPQAILCFEKDIFKEKNTHICQWYFEKLRLYLISCLILFRCVIIENELKSAIKFMMS